MSCHVSEQNSFLRQTNIIDRHYPTITTAVKIARGVIGVAVAIVVLTPSSIFAQQSTPDSTRDPAVASSDVSDASKELIEKLQRAISHTQWTGNFTLTGSDAAPKKESYQIIDAVHQSGDQWLLTARIAYGDRDVTVPIPLEIKWAGRTPVITVDNLTIPPLGTFDARVLIRKGSYAGTWAHGDKGGHLFGKYEKMEPVTDSSD